MIFNDYNKLKAEIERQSRYFNYESSLRDMPEFKEKGLYYAKILSRIEEWETMVLSAALMAVDEEFFVNIGEKNG